MVTNVLPPFLWFTVYIVLFTRLPYICSSVMEWIARKTVGDALHLVTLSSTERTGINMETRRMGKGVKLG